MLTSNSKKLPRAGALLMDPLSSGKGTEGLGPNPGSLIPPVAVAVAGRKSRPTGDALSRYSEVQTVSATITFFSIVNLSSNLAGNKLRNGSKGYIIQPELLEVLKLYRRSHQWVKLLVLLKRRVNWWVLKFVCVCRKVPCGDELMRDMVVGSNCIVVLCLVAVLI